MKKTLRLGAVLSLLVVFGCTTDLSQALLLAGESGTRTFLDIFISDLFSDLPDLFTIPPGPGEPGATGQTGQTGGTAGQTGGGGALTGNAENGASLFKANSCFGCHCDDASGGCLPAAPNIQGVDLATVREQLQGDRPHTGGKFPDLTEQDIADIQAFLASQATP